MTSFHRSSISLAVIATLSFALAACNKSRSHTAQSQDAPHGGVMQPYAGKLPPDDGQWTMPAKDYGAYRYSQLDQINTGNAKDLKLAFTFSTGTLNGLEAAPLVVNNTMYIITSFPNFLYALDLTKPGAPMKWSYNPKPVASAKGVACCDLVNRGGSYYKGKIIYNTLDGYTVAVDANDGHEVWRTKLGDINLGESITMAAQIVKDKVLVGNSGGEFGVRGWVTALNADTGKIVWKAYNTGPDKDVLIGDKFKPFYSQYKGKDLGVQSWPPDQWKIGGGNMWGWIAYDPDTNVVFHGTGNAGPWNPDQRPGDNQWTSGIFARDADTGEALWFYQFTPHDTHDYDGINEQILLDLPINGQTRKVLIRPERNGYVYVMDRTNGEVLSATPYGHITTSTGVDLKTGRFQPVEDKIPHVGKVVHEACPAAPGVKDWNPSAYSPKTGLLYIPHNNLCMDWESIETGYIAGTPYVGADVKMYAGPGGNGGRFSAWDILGQKEVWGFDDRFPVWSGAVVTAGDVVFYGTLDGWFIARNAKDGTELWRFKTGSGIIGQPITYKGPDGKQYIAILSGVGGWVGAIVSGGLDARDPTAALGFVNATKDLPKYTNKGGMLYVFALP